MADEIFQMEFGSMAGEDEEVIVTIPASTDGTTVTKVGDGGAVVKTAPAGGAAASDDPMVDLKSQFATMTQRATAAEQREQQAAQRAQQAEQRAHHAEGSVVSSQLDTVLSGIAAAEAEAKSAEAEFVTAAEAGDFPAQARAQRKISQAETRIQRLAEAKDDLEDAKARQPREPKPHQQQRAAPTDPVEQVASTLSSRSAAWVRAHPECITNPKLNARMMAAHNLAVAEDVELDSEEYFQRIEAGVKPKSAAAEPKPSAGDGRRPPSGAAAGGGGGGALNGGTEVRLTRGEAQSATDGTLVWNYDDPSGQKKWVKGDPIGLSEMARRKMEGQKRGLYDKNAMEA